MRVSISILLMLSVCARADTPPSPGTTEARYFAPGPFAVRVTTTCTTSDAFGNLTANPGAVYDLYSPPLSMSNPRPIVTWANGSGQYPIQYDFFLRHLASWGFVVVASCNTTTHDGVTTWNAAQSLVDANANPSSPFYQSLDTANVAAVGHSQGAGGAMNALLLSWGIVPLGSPPGSAVARSDGVKIRTVMNYGLPASNECAAPYLCTAGLQPAGSSIFYVDGSLDLLISPPTQATPECFNTSDDMFHPECSIQAYYDNTYDHSGTGGTVLKAKMAVNGAGHSDIEGDGQGCPPRTLLLFPCLQGVNRLLGYPTAWLVWQLVGAQLVTPGGSVLDTSDAHNAFVKSTGELFGNGAFSYQDTNVR